VKHSRAAKIIIKSLAHYKHVSTI